MGHVPGAVKELNLKPAGPLPGAQPMRISIGLPLRNRQELDRFLEQLYDPASPSYRHYLTPAQFTERFGPTEEDYQAVVAFARSNGLAVTSIDPGRVLVDVRASVADIERVCHVRLQVYPHPTESRLFYAPDSEPWLDLKTSVLHITGLDNLSLPHPALGGPGSVNASSGAGSGPGGTLMGYDFRAAYVPGVSQTGAGQTVALVEFDGYYPSDITDYEQQAGLPSVLLANVPLDGFDMTPSTHAKEVSMDIELVISMAPGLAGVLVYAAPSWDVNSYVNDVLERIATDNLAQQISASWTLTPDVVGLAFLQQMAAQGQSFFLASGDGGAYVNGSDPRWWWEPNDNPYVTSVGGTTLTTSGPGGFWLSETTWTGYTSGYGTNASGGGISTNYTIPFWQTNTSMASNGGSTRMRNCPDVAMVAENVWVVYDNGKTGSSGGTSASAPLWAGFTALVNETAASYGLRKVGFLNPALYRLGNSSVYSSFFHDITSGNNTNLSSHNLFYACPGYDLCTGWGSPKGMNLINALVFQDPLSVSPETDFRLSGGAGGPFSLTNQTFLLLNTGSSNLTWSAASSSAWLIASPGSGVLVGGASTNVTVSLAPLTAELAEGSVLRRHRFQQSHTQKPETPLLHVASWAVASHFRRPQRPGRLRSRRLRRHGLGEFSLSQRHRYH